MSQILVTAKVHPDLDGTACTVAYADLLTRTGTPAVGLIFGRPQTEVEYFQKEQGITVPLAGNNKKYKNFILVDASSMTGMPEIVRPGRVLEIIDHRAGEPEAEFPQAKIQNELIGAAATIIVERFQQSGVHPLPDHAKLLYGAIFHNSLNLLSSNTSPRDFQAVKYLESQFNLKRSLASGMFRYTTNAIYSDIDRAVLTDAKEFTHLNSSIGAYQLVLWHFDPGEWSAKIADSIGEADRKMASRWSFLNVVDVGTNTSHLFCASEQGRRQITAILNSGFNNGWAVIKPALLRKQIMPLLRNSGNIR